MGVQYDSYIIINPDKILVSLQSASHASHATAKISLGKHHFHEHSLEATSHLYKFIEAQLQTWFQMYRSYSRTGGWFVNVFRHTGLTLNTVIRTFTCFLCNHTKYWYRPRKQSSFLNILIMIFWVRQLKDSRRVATIWQFWLSHWSISSPRNVYYNSFYFRWLRRAPCLVDWFSESPISLN